MKVPILPIRLLSLSMLFAMFGTNMFLVSLSVHFFESTSSNLAAAGVYVAQFLPAIFLMPIAWKICDRLPFRRALITLEMSSAALTALVGIAVLVGYEIVGFALLAVRGFVEMTTKSARGVAVRNLVPTSDVGRANLWVTAGNFVGQTVGAVVGFWLIATASMEAVLSVGVAAFLISALVCAYLPTIAAVGASNTVAHASLWRAARQTLSRDMGLLRAFFYLLATVVLLQSLNQVVRVGLPLSWLKLPSEIGALNETIGSIGVFVGLMVVWRYFADANQHSNKLPFLFLVAVFFSSVTFFLPPEPVTAFIIYFFFMVTFEVSYMVALNGVLSLCRSDEAPTVMVLFYGLGFGGMTIIALLMGAYVDLYGFTMLALVLIGVSVVLTLLVEYNIKQQSTLSD
jgi:MFS family permease